MAQGVIPEDRTWSKDIADCHVYLRDRWPRLQEMFTRETGNTLILTCTWRSVAEQQRLYAHGRTAPGKIVTWVDGIKKASEHNKYPARAMDVAVVELVHGGDGVSSAKISWDWHLYVPLLAICKSLELESGGAWEKKDWPHVQMPAQIWP